MGPGQPALTATDGALLLGMGVFETLMVHRGVAFRLPQHLDRLRRAAVRFAIPLPQNVEEEIQLFLKVLRPFDQAALRVTLIGGHGTGPDSDPGKPRLLIHARTPGSVPIRGISVARAGSPVNPLGATTGFKTLNYLEALDARRVARLKGADDALRTNLWGEVVGGAMANVFVLRRGVLLTPNLESGTLPGITRGVVRELTAEGTVPLVERGLGLRELLEADEIFFTNSLKGIVPVVSVDGGEVGDGVPGPFTRGLEEAYVKRVAEETGRPE